MGEKIKVVYSCKKVITGVLHTFSFERHRMISMIRQFVDPKKVLTDLRIT